MERFVSMRGTMREAITNELVIIIGIPIRRIFAINLEKMHKVGLGQLSSALAYRCYWQALLQVRAALTGGTWAIPTAPVTSDQ